ncbi:hypothetical protein PQX77_004303 [Marasmius sp. AFHP31]|nr:hypothetical protein PQX77_004303 [Marasmius sp. AFHP31]
MKSDPPIPKDRFQPYNLRKRTKRVDYSLWFPDSRTEGGLKPAPSSRLGRERRRKVEPGSNDPGEIGGDLRHQALRENETTVTNIPQPSHPVQAAAELARNRKKDPEPQGFLGMINCALFELCPALQETDDLARELRAMIDPVGAGLNTRLGLPVGTTIEGMQEVFEVDLAPFARAVKDIVNRIISLLELVDHALEELRIGHSAVSVDLLWSQPTGIEFRWTDGQSPTTLRDGMICLREDMALLVPELKQRLSALKRMHGMTERVKNHLSMPMPPEGDVTALRTLREQCSRSEKGASCAIATMKSFGRRLSTLVEPTGDWPDAIAIDVESFHSRMERLKELRDKAIDEALVKELLVLDSGL